MKKTLSSLAVGSLLLLVGAGCAPSSTPPEANNQVPPNALETTTPDAMDKPQENMVTELNLTAEALGGNRVKFNWSLPTGMAEPASFRLVRGSQADPASPGSYYFQLLGNKRETTWISLPAGTQNFRICTFSDDKCEVYSNNVEVEVK